ncbi:FUSC family protein [Alcanivorax sp. S6407]|uniref:FUSC family protein n=1 Tax=Alcanivorax sp. S6407 TaxID=2926424 RepID=UPI001FF2484D|nr:FUSC family protein [Alcanivorax sp. S6407]MCK0152684.1 FUSC family protein [Alcanivorax sp. S6407]
MTINPSLATVLTPDRRSVIFACKGILSMALALYLAMQLQLERPYWALISAVFLQIRPETGLVIEKGLCQIGGTLVGGAMGLLILAWLLPYPVFAIAALTLWIGINAAASAWVRQANFIYGFAMAGITASLIVVIPIANPHATSSIGIFHVATARVSEIILGAVCATLVSNLFWPARVEGLLRSHARNALNQTLAYLELELDPAGTHDRRHRQVDQLLQDIFALSDDSSAVTYEGSQGPGRARAATVICHKTLSLVARSRVIGRLMRYHDDLMTDEMRKLLVVLRTAFTAMRETPSAEQAMTEAKALRRYLKQARQQQPEDAPALQRRLFLVARNLTSDLILALEANRALYSAEEMQLRAPTLKPYRDWQVAAAVGLRSALVFLIASILWIGTASPMAIMLMIMPVIFTIMFARLAEPDKVLKRATITSALAGPAALFLSLPLISMANNTFLLLILGLGGPIFVALLAISRRETLPYGLGFCTPFIILVQPGTQMDFDIARVASNALAITLGLFLAFMMFRLITPPNGAGLRRRLVRDTAIDLHTLLGQPANLREEWLNSRMADRLRWLTVCDKALPESRRHYTDLGLTGLNLGQVSLWIHSRIPAHPSDALRTAAADWQHALASAYQLSAFGATDQRFSEASNTLLAAMADTPSITHRQRQQIAGALERINLTFPRLADRLGPDWQPEDVPAPSGLPS